jgi:hypothetical protein
MTAVVDSPPPHVSPKKMWVTKLLLRILQICIAIALISCVAASLTKGWWGFATLVVILPQSFISFVWVVTECICILLRGGRRGIYPGACVGVDLVLWLALIIGTGLLGVWGLATDIASKNGGYGEDWSTGNGGYDWHDYLDDYDDYWDDLYDIWFHATSKTKKKKRRPGPTLTTIMATATDPVAAAVAAAGMTTIRGRLGGDPALIKPMAALSTLLL